MMVLSMLGMLGGPQVHAVNNNAKFCLELFVTAFTGPYCQMFCYPTSHPLLNVRPPLISARVALS
jgi:hypothetical protein